MLAALNCTDKPWYKPLEFPERSKLREPVFCMQLSTLMSRYRDVRFIQITGVHGTRARAPVSMHVAMSAGFMPQVSPKPPSPGVVKSAGS